MSRTAAVCLTVALGLCSVGRAAPPATAPVTGDPICKLAGEDQSWLARAPSTWALVESRAFRLAPISPPPAFVFFDRQCAYASATGVSWTATAHNGSIRLPDGQSVPPQVISFAAPRKDGGPFMVMALPSIWKAGSVTSDMGLDRLMFAVFDHEMAHTRQFGVYSPKLDALEKQYGLADDLDDDAVETRFKSEAEFAASIEEERRLLFAATRDKPAEARAKARQVLKMIRARQAKWYVGGQTRYVELEDIFLTMEGIGQFAGYAWLIDPDGGALAPAEAIPGMRRTKQPWSQDEGLGIMLVVQKLAPDWPALAFGPRSETALDLLSRVAGTP